MIYARQHVGFFFSLMINRNFAHCFLLDGKILLPIDRRFQSINEKNLGKEINLIRSLNERSFVLLFLIELHTCLASAKASLRDSSSEKSYQSPWAIKIIIKPFISSEDHRIDTSQENKCKYSSFSNPFKSNSTQRTNRILSTFRDQQQQSMETSTPILHSRTLLNIYQSRKQQF